MEPEKLTYQLERLGIRIREIRKQKGLTLVDLEAATGIPNGKISKIENGMVNMEFYTLARIADALRVEIFELFNYDAPFAKQ